jgi:chromosome partitioning protein
VKTIAIANIKGGVGKTSIAVNFAVGLARSGQRTLLVDLDIQANATRWLMPAGVRTGIGDALLRADGERALTDGEVLEVPGRKNLWLSPSSQQLRLVDIALANEVAGETILKKALGSVAKRFDFCVLDCPPNLGITVLSALYAADSVIAPAMAAHFSLSGIRTLEETLERMRERLKIRTDVLGFVLFATDEREAITREARELLREYRPAKLFKHEVRVSTAGKSLPSSQKTVWDEGADERGAGDYRAILREAMQRMGAR